MKLLNLFRIRNCFSLFAVFSLFLMPRAAGAQPFEMNYEVQFDTAAHYVDVRLRYISRTAQAPGSDTVRLCMPVWAPGYYLILDYPKNMVDFRAEDSRGHALAWEKSGKSMWKIFPEGADTLFVSYRVFAWERSVAESRVGSESAFLATNGVFLYPENGKNCPVEVTFVLPDNWKTVSTGLTPVGTKPGEAATQRRTFAASDFDVLYDSPVLLGNQESVLFRHEGKDYELAMETPDGWEETPFLDDLKSMMTAATRLMGDVPYDRYCYILLGAGGGGLEHLNSQASYTQGNFRFANRDEYLRFFSFVTHEYFHLYNVKAIRPIELGPFDYEREVFTPMLWVSEGFTVYYETQLLLRAGIADADYLLSDLSSFIRTVESREGHRHMSLRQSSYDIWLNFFNRNPNGAATRISYYDKGPILGLLMDIEIRRLTHGEKSLDDVMRLLYYTYFIEKKRGFTEEEFWDACREVAGQPLRLMRHYVDTTAEIDYEKCLAPAGLGLDRTTWTLYRLPDPRAEALKIRKQMLLE